jgi:hypothetical protein
MDAAALLTVFAAIVTSSHNVLLDGVLTEEPLLIQTDALVAFELLPNGKCLNLIFDTKLPLEPAVKTKYEVVPLTCPELAAVITTDQEDEPPEEKIGAVFAGILF